jgi:two-component system OmpR family response regulator
LVVEDEPKMARLLGRGLQEEGLAADVASTGEEALWFLGCAHYDVIVLDLLLPGISGVEVCRTLRSRQVWTPVLMLTALGAVESRVTGLDAGADDYLVKPFAFVELLARLRVLTRRPDCERPTVLEVGGLRLDPATRSVWRGGVHLTLTSKEFGVLHAFMRRPGEVLTRGDILDEVWDFAYERGSNVVDVHVRSLRIKLDEPFGTDSFETVRGAGYRLRVEGP